jgi:hypothetical protein
MMAVFVFVTSGIMMTVFVRLGEKVQEDITHKTKVQVTRTTLKTWGELRWSKRVSSSSSIMQECTLCNPYDGNQLYLKIILTST